MFFNTEIWNFDSYRLKEILDRHFRVVSIHDIHARLKHIAMDSKMWKPDVEAFDQYCIRFSGILNELDSSSVSQIRGLIGKFISGIEPRVLREDIEVENPVNIISCATLAREKCIEFMSAYAIRSCYNRNFHSKNSQKFSQHKYDRDSRHSRSRSLDSSDSEFCNNSRSSSTDSQESRHESRKKIYTGSRTRRSSICYSSGRRRSEERCSSKNSS